MLLCLRLSCVVLGCSKYCWIELFVFIIVALVCVRFYKFVLDSLTLGYLRLGYVGLCWVVLG